MNEESINEMIIKCPACSIEGIAKSIMKEIFMNKSILFVNNTNKYNVKES